MKNVKTFLNKYFPISIRGWLIFIVTMGTASGVCWGLSKATDSDTHVPLIFVLAVLIIALCTDGYFYGLLSSLISVLGVNYAFTYPYMVLDFSVYGYPLTFMTMLAVGFAGSTLTTRVKAQEKLRAESEKEKMRANLLRAISHDLRTPLTSISGSISTVLDGEALTQEQKNELLMDAKQDAEWLCRMVENLLSITRISDGSMAELHKDEEVVEEIFSEVVSNFRKRHSNVHVSVSVPDTMMLLPMDAMLIEQVIINLMDNALTHGKTTTEITLSARFEGEHAVISVSDNGQGIAPPALPHLFDGSLQLSSPDNSRFMGIGLSVCRTIVEAHGGKITAYNKQGGGACFEFTLPLGA
jgi:two-component system sensor histidine kinase KdpD